MPLDNKPLNEYYFLNTSCEREILDIWPFYIDHIVTTLFTSSLWIDSISPWLVKHTIV